MVAADLDPVEIVPAQVRAAAAKSPPREHRSEPDPLGCSEVETALEGCLWRGMQAEPPRVGVRIAVRGHHEGRPSDPDQLQHGWETEAVGYEHPQPRAGEGDVAGAAAIGSPAKGVDAPHELGVETDARAESKAASVDAPERDAPRSPSGKQRRGCTGSRGTPSARGRTLVPPPGMNPTGVDPSMPLSTSLKVPSPEKT